MLIPSSLKEMFRLHRVSVMKQRRKAMEHRGPDIDAIRHADWREANYEQQEMNERNHLLNTRNVEAQHRIADALEKLLATRIDGATPHS